MSYPMVSQVPLDPVTKQGFLSRPRRQISTMPRPLPHQRLVFEYDGAFLLADRLLKGDEPYVVNGQSISVVDVTRDHPVTVEVRIGSSGAHEFLVSVQFRCTVDEPIEVVRAGLTDVRSNLSTYLRAYHRLFELGRDYGLDQVQELRKVVHAQVKAYGAVVPPVLPGMSAEFTGLDVYAPQEIVKGRQTYETSLAQIQGEHGLREAERQLAWDLDLNEQAYLNLKNRNANDFTRQELSLDRTQQLHDATRLRDFLNSGPGAADGLYVATPGLSAEQVASRYALLGDRDYEQARRGVELQSNLEVVEARARAEVIRVGIAQGLFNEVDGRELLAIVDRVQQQQAVQPEDLPEIEGRAESGVGDPPDEEPFMEEDVRG
ncbi:hypothetical protein [Herbidospora sp. NBRC 101105]|uniref:hypothetical protein n=1 Tax=Herbidospora sp. NBRC 101105 TaxID=3032195 RepID=UPI0024A56B93|nr:hypothetical protein [Herbidospora sp. NBRC 101105]GLX95215.1 hypothetical protein Hesp01_31650 [Herbidospora sp. NBRC 101105]